MSTNKTGNDSTAEDHLFDIFLSALAATFPTRIEKQRALWAEEKSAAELATVRAQLAEAITQRDELQRQLDKTIADNNARKGTRFSFENGEITVSPVWAAELAVLYQEVERLTVELKATRAQRNATQRALHKANHDNDELRQRLPNMDVSWITSPRTVHRISKQLVDGGEGGNDWID